MINTSILNIIISKFYYTKNLYLIIQFKVDKNLKINFYYTTLSFNLVIQFLIKKDRKFLLHIKKINIIIIKILR